MKPRERLEPLDERDRLLKAAVLQLDKILASNDFKSSSRRQLLLRTIVTQSLAGHADSLKEVVLARDVFGRADYDPSRHTQVRVEINNVRRKLAAYYEKADPADRVRIDIPLGHYVAIFSELPESSIATFTSRRRHFSLSSLLFIVSGLPIAFIAMWSMWPSRPQLVGAPIQITFDTGWTAQPAVSRDGSVLVYSSDRGPRGDRDIWIQEPGRSPRQLTTDPAHDMTPDISPDGKQVAFRSWRNEPGIWAVPAAGGDAKLLAPGGYLPRFSPDGRWISFVGDADGTGHIFVIPAAGGVATRFDYGTDEASCPVWTSDGKSIIFLARNTVDSAFDFWRINAQPHRAQTATPLHLQSRLHSQSLPPLANGSDCPQDWIDNNLLFDIDQHETASLLLAPLGTFGRVNPIQLLPFAIGIEAVRAIPDTPRRRTIVFAAERRQTNIWATNLTASSPLVQLTHDGSLLSGSEGTWPALSGDGNVLAFITERTGSPDICVKDLRVPNNEQLLGARPLRSQPIFLDQTGDSLIYVRAQFPANAIVLRNIAQKTERILTSACPVLHDWSAWRGVLLCSNSTNLFELRVADSAEVPLLHLLASPFRARYSPDGHWLSFSTQIFPGDTMAAFVAPIDGSGKVVPICREMHDVSLHWSPSGNAVYYWCVRDGFRCLYAQSLNPLTKTPLGKPIVVLHRHGSQHYPWSGGTLALAPGRIVMTLKDETSNIWKAELPR